MKQYKTNEDNVVNLFLFVRFWYCLHFEKLYWSTEAFYCSETMQCFCTRHRANDKDCCVSKRITNEAMKLCFETPYTKQRRTVSLNEEAATDYFETRFIKKWCHMNESYTVKGLKCVTEHDSRAQTADLIV